MMTREEVHASLDKWWTEGQVGNIFFFKAPRANLADGFVEQTIKDFEMSEATADIMRKAFGAAGSQRVEMFSGRGDVLDRIKVTRKLT